MADEIRVTDRNDVPRDALVGRPEPPSVPPEAIDDPEVARAEIQATRARMSETISEIEDVLVRRKERIQDKLDVLSPVRENPLPSAGIALGAGLLLGLLTGGGGEEDQSDTTEEWHEWSGPAYTAAATAGAVGTAAMGEGHYGAEDDGYWRRRAETWESRARRLRDIAHRQEEELRSLRATAGERRTVAFEAEDWEPQRYEESDEPDSLRELRSTLEDLKDTVVTGVTDFLTNTVNDLVHPGTGRRRT